MTTRATTQRSTPARAQRLLRRVGPGVELQVAQHIDLAHADGAQARGVGLGLRPGGGQRAVGGAQQQAGAGHRAAISRTSGRWPAPWAGRARRLSCIWLGQISVSISKPTSGLKCVRKRRVAPRGVLHGCQTLDVARAQQLLPFGAAGGGAVRQQQTHCRQALAQRGQQDGGGACFRPATRRESRPAGRAHRAAPWCNSQSARPPRADSPARPRRAGAACGATAVARARWPGCRARGSSRAIKNNSGLRLLHQRWRLVLH